MRKLMAILAVLGLALSLLTTTASAKTTVSEKVEAGPTALPLSIFSGYKMKRWDDDGYAPMGNFCVANGANELPIAVAAQAWNNASTGFGLDYSSNCVLDGYTHANDRMTIDTYDALDGVCYKMTNTEYGTYDTFRHYYNNIVGWVNTNAAQGCASTSQRRAHWTSFVIGRALGMKRLDGSEWANRVMCYCSQDTVAYPSGSTDGPAVSGVYNELYFGPY